MAFTLYTQPFGSTYANGLVTIINSTTGAPATILSSATGGLVNNQGQATLDSSGNLSVYIDTAYTYTFRVSTGTTTPSSSAISETIFDPGINASRALTVDDFNGTPRNLDVVGRLKTSYHKNIYEADFEYGPQPLRWEALTVGGASVTHVPGSGGVRLRLSATVGDVSIRQSRPYHRYQPGKTMYMATAVNLGTAQVGQVQRVGFFDDSNGIFIEQGDPATGNPFGMNVVVRNDIQGGAGVVNELRVPMTQWDGYNLPAVQALDWTRMQMVWMEFAWYGAGCLRWGVMIDGKPVVLHKIGMGNRSGQTTPWSRTGNLPVRYEQRNITSAVGNDMYHYGVSVLVEGGVDDQRGFTYAYGLPQSVNAARRSVAAAANRFPIVSVRGRQMGTQEYTQASAACTAGTTTSLTASTAAWTTDQWKGRFVSYTVSGSLYTARITTNSATVLTLADVVTGGALSVAPVAGQNYTIGLINRGQLLPRRLQVTSDQSIYVEIFVSTPSSPITLTGSNFTVNSAASNSFAQIDSSATAFTTSGECVYSLFIPANNPVDQQIDYMFPLYNTIRGNATDILTVVVTNPQASAANVSVQLIGQEAMS